MIIQIGKYKLNDATYSVYSPKLILNKINIYKKNKRLEIRILIKKALNKTIFQN